MRFVPETAIARDVSYVVIDRAKPSALDGQHRHTVMQLPYFQVWVRLGSIRRDK